MFTVTKRGWCFFDLEKYIITMSGSGRLEFFVTVIGSVEEKN